MKNTMRIFFVFFLTAISLTSIAQDATKEIATLTKQFQTAYNKADSKTLTTLLTADAVRVAADGTVIKGADMIGANYSASFAASETKLEVKITKTTKQSETKALSIGTFSVTGKNKKTNEKVESKGTYENELVKEGGKWKISSIKLTAAK